MSLEFYAANVKEIINEVQGDVAKLNNSGDFNGLTTQSLYEKLKSARNSLEEMEHELIMVPTNEKQKAINRINAFRNDINQLEERLKTGTQRTQLLGDASSLPNTARESFQEAQNSMSEAVKIGNNILTSLNDQKQKILHSIDGVSGIDAVVASASSITQRMKQRQNQNKLITYGVIVLLVIGILLLLYLAF